MEEPGVGCNVRFGDRRSAWGKVSIHPGLGRSSCRGGGGSGGGGGGCAWPAGAAGPAQSDTDELCQPRGQIVGGMGRWWHQESWTGCVDPGGTVIGGTVVCGKVVCGTVLCRMGRWWDGALLA